MTQIAFVNKNYLLTPLTPPLVNCRLIVQSFTLPTQGTTITMGIWLV